LGRTLSGVPVSGCPGWQDCLLHCRIGRVETSRGCVLNFIASGSSNEALTVLFHITAGKEFRKKMFLRELPEAAYQSDRSSRSFDLCSSRLCRDSRGAQDDSGRRYSPTETESIVTHSRRRGVIGTKRGLAHAFRDDDLSKRGTLHQCNSFSLRIGWL
jgi:hypothetical protein